MARGDHLYVCRDAFKGVRVGRTLYTHHAIDMGDGTVIEYVSRTDTKRDSVILRRQLDDFAQGGRVGIREYGRRFDGETAATRAESMLGTTGYDFFTNNCEHFASWCVTGQPSSSQIENGMVGAGLATTTAVAPAVGIELVGTFGSAAVRSGPNLMSGLSAIGGSAVGGIAVLGGASGLIATGIMCRALADKPTLPTDQREARRTGRQAAFGGSRPRNCGRCIHSRRDGRPRLQRRRDQLWASQRLVVSPGAAWCAGYRPPSSSPHYSLSYSDTCSTATRCVVPPPRGPAKLPLG